MNRSPSLPPSLTLSLQGIWPWSYDQCDGQIPFLETKQEINACTSGDDVSVTEEKMRKHGLHPGQGRGSPEIDIFEVMLGHRMPNVAEPFPAFMSSSLQIAPGLETSRRPKNGHELNSSYSWSSQFFPSLLSL
jgi:hypothetical protein